MARLTLSCLLAGGLLLVSCRDGSSSDFTAINRIDPSFFGAHGCNGPNQMFMLPVAVYSDPAIGPLSQIAAAKFTDTLYLTGEDGSIRELDVSGMMAMETILVAPGVIDALLLLAGIATPAAPSGIGVVDLVSLVVAENTSNTILHVDRTIMNDVVLLAGGPQEAGDFMDGQGAAARFDFDAPCMIAPTSNGSPVYVADSGNHAIREVNLSLFPLTLTVSGTGNAGIKNGLPGNSAFDTPVGVSISCGGEILVIESGGNVAGAGNRLRTVGIGDFNTQASEFEGNVMTLAGSGSNATTEGRGSNADLGTPVSIASSSVDEVYFVDSLTGILRRYSFSTRMVDCPLFLTCADAVTAGGRFSGAGNYSVAVSESGHLYVLDTNAETIYRVSP